MENSLIVKSKGEELFRIAKNGDIFLKGRKMMADVELANFIWNKYVSEYKANSKATSVTALHIQNDLED